MAMNLKVHCDKNQHQSVRISLAPTGTKILFFCEQDIVLRHSSTQKFIKLLSGQIKYSLICFQIIVSVKTETHFTPSADQS